MINEAEILSFKQQLTSFGRNRINTPYWLHCNDMLIMEIFKVLRCSHVEET